MNKPRPVHYYSSHAYDLNKTPVQPPSSRKKTKGMRLPWGSTLNIAPDNFVSSPTPEELRSWEKQKKEKGGDFEKQAPLVDIELHHAYDHERIRFAQLPFRSQFWLIMNTGGKWSFIMLLPIFLLSCLLGIDGPTGSILTNYSNNVVKNFPVLMGPWLMCWLIGHVVINCCPRIWFRPPKGPLWEFNRRTGLVTIFDYKRHRKEGVINEFSAPFYEFDAYMLSTWDRHGTYYGLLLHHRYEDQQINFHALLAPDDFKHRPCALWDFLQNYMDTSRPLPDIPLFEPHRHLDPVTAQYDQENGREPRYWIDMDDETFKGRVDAMWQRASAIDTFRRPNLMERYVSYHD